MPPRRELPPLPHAGVECPLLCRCRADEGHKLKNPRMQLRKQLDAVPVALRIIISGTPIQVGQCRWQGAGRQAASKWAGLLTMMPVGRPAGQVRMQQASLAMRRLPGQRITVSCRSLFRSAPFPRPRPPQNNLLEMWALFNFCAPDVLGSAPDF